MAVSKASANAITPAAKGAIAIGSGTNAAGVLAAGTNNYVLTADSAETLGVKWATASGWNPDYQLLNAGGTALTGATTVTVSGISGKKALYVWVDSGGSANASAYILVRFNSDTGNNYVYSAIYPDAVGVTTAYTNATGGNQLYLFRIGSNALNEGYAHLHIEGCDTTGIKPFTYAGTGQGSGSDTRESWVGTGFYKGTSAITSVTIVSNSGNLDEGTVYIYGA